MKRITNKYILEMVRKYGEVYLEVYKNNQLNRIRLLRKGLPITWGGANDCYVKPSLDFAHDIACYSAARKFICHVGIRVKELGVRAKLTEEVKAMRKYDTKFILKVTNVLTKRQAKNKGYI